MARNPTAHGSPALLPTQDWLPASPRMHPDADYRRTVPRHVSMCYTYARVAGLGWSGPQAIPHSPRPEGTGEHLNRFPTGFFFLWKGLQVRMCTLLRYSCFP